MRSCVRKAASECEFDEDTVQKLVLAVDEACTNIIRHAYEGKQDGKIEIEINSDPKIWEIRIRDYGKKCDASKLKGRDLEEIKPGGLGLFFIHQAFDEVHFDQSLDEGTCLILRKKRS
jgi:anti-sigma regulatory factor (Ser/Thr protein kinase)